MEYQCTSLNLDFFLQDKGIMMEELWHSLLVKNMELETKVASTKEEITKKKDELLTLTDILSQAIRERDQAESKCQAIMSDIATLQQQIVSHNVITEEQPIETNQFVNAVHEGQLSRSSSSSSSLSSSSSELPPEAEKLVEEKTLPEKGKLLQAMMETGPLLQTLLLAGPLPEWKHPPPSLDTVEIPPVIISCTPNFLTFTRGFSCLSNKRSLPDSDHSVFQSNPKTPKLALY